MNKYTKEIIRDVKGYCNAYLSGTAAALRKYRQASESARREAGRYKDEAEYIRQKETAAAKAARREIDQARTALESQITIAVKGLREELHQHLTTKPQTAFLDTLRVYADFNIQPTKAEIEAMIDQNKGNSLGYKALNAVLEKTGAEYRIDAFSVDGYEEDLHTLEKLAEPTTLCAPDEYYPEAVAVFSGEPALYLRADGSTVDNGRKHDKTSILVYATAFRENMGKLDGMEARWTDGILPSLKHFAPDNEDTEKAPEQQYEEEYADTARTGAECTEHQGEAFALQLGKEANAAADSRKAVLDHYA